MADEEVQALDQEQEQPAPAPANDNNADVKELLNKVLNELDRQAKDIAEMKAQRVEQEQEDLEYEKLTY